MAPEQDWHARVESQTAAYRLGTYDERRLVERSTRYVMLLHLPDDHGAQSVEVAMRKAIRNLPEELARSVTWDQGSEMAGHVNFTVATGIPVYFCDPYSPPLTGQSGYYSLQQFASIA
jgi:IS30 family transposase